jgi:hypothetical protein
MTPDNTSAADLTAARRPHEVYTEADDRDSCARKNILLVSYGEYVTTAEIVDYGPIVERALGLAKFHFSIRDGSKIVRREWFAATNPDIAVAHIYLRI